MGRCWKGIEDTINESLKGIKDSVGKNTKDREESIGEGLRKVWKMLLETGGKKTL